jgi:acylphosphatase
MPTRIHIVVEGRVQGVCFRYECRRQAARLALVGWVKNLDDGSVEIVAEGEKGAVEQLAAWSRRGPQGAFVTACRANPESPTGEFDAFEIRF